MKLQIVILSDSDEENIDGHDAPSQCSRTCLVSKQYSRTTGTRFLLFLYSHISFG